MSTCLADRGPKKSFSNQVIKRENRNEHGHEHEGSKNLNYLSKGQSLIQIFELTIHYNEIVFSAFNLCAVWSQSCFYIYLKLLVYFKAI